MAVRTPSTKKKGANRQGAKAVKKLERVSSTGDLTPHEATMFRAFSARANFLAQDRPAYCISDKRTLSRIRSTEPSKLHETQERCALLDWPATPCLSVCVAKEAHTFGHIRR